MAESGKPAEETASFVLWGREVRVPLAFLGVLLTVLGALFGSWISLVAKDHELKIKLVEIGIGILRSDPKEELTPARGWAVEVIEQNSGVKFSEEDKELLLKKPIKFTGWADGSYVDSYDGSYDTGTPAKLAKPNPQQRNPIKDPADTAAPH